MKYILGVFSFVLFGLFAQDAWPSDACTDGAIYTAAAVSVSDGSEFKTESYFRSHNAAAIRHLDAHDQVVAVEGPLSWIRQGDKSRLGGPFEKAFTLGHQYHALLLHFTDIVDNVQRTQNVEFDGSARSAMSGENPYGGVIHLIDGGDEAHPAGFVFEIPETPAIESRFSNWRSVGDVELPYHIRIDDGQRVFDYRYTNVDLAPKPLMWFTETVGTPNLDELKIYRLHRNLLAAHCLGDHDLIADLSAPEMVSANRGELRVISKTASRDRFQNVFELLDYTEYHDLIPPIIQVSESADLGWIAVNVQAVGVEKENQTRFDDQWSWLMVVKNIDGRWVHAGNASNFVQ